MSDDLPSPFTYGSDEEAAFCDWIARTHPSDPHVEWAEARTQYLPLYRAARESRARLKAWERSVARQRALAKVSPDPKV